MLTWPTQLPAVASALSFDAQAVDIRSKITEALIEQRKRQPGQTITLKVQWLMTDTEFGLFASWHRFSINLGNDWFGLWLPISSDSNELHKVRFQSGQFSISYQEGKCWSVTATLDIYELLGDIGEDGYDALEIQLAAVDSDSEGPIDFCDTVDGVDRVTTWFRQD